MLQDQKIMLAVSKILQRSERQVDDEKIVETFVDLGVVAQLANRNNQIIYGRRGTGKTHVFRVLRSQLEDESEANVVVYIDARTLGSSAQFSNESVELQRRVVALLRDIFGPIYNSLLEHIVERVSDNANRALTALDQLIPAITETDKTLQEEKRTTAASTSTSSDAKATATFGQAAEIALGAARGEIKAETVEQRFATAGDAKIVFPALSESLADVLKLSGAQLYLLIDEWSSLPADLQPYLSEFVKRTLLPLEDVTIKIAALEYRSHFSAKNSSGFVGFELGADVATAPDLDDYYVFDRNPDRITDAYGEILLRHMNVELPPNYLADRYAVRSGADLGSKLFTQRPTLQELARACEGVIRDLINIFTKAFFHAQRRGRGTIDQKAVLEGAREWFEQDKARSLDDDMNHALRRIVDFVIGGRRARSFLMQREFERHGLIQRLIDARVLHLMQRGYADKDNPGVRYNIYSLDYGTYVDLIGTSKQPQIDMSESATEADVVVPFDDKRSIRRIVLDPAVLEPQQAPTA
jgi:hypothetical protein